jgi:outer membrane biosynthesis protein TonB
MATSLSGEAEARAMKPKSERSSIASFFGFGPKADGPRTETPRPEVTRPETAHPETARTEPTPAAELPRPPTAPESDQPRKKGWWQKRAES